MTQAKRPRLVLETATVEIERRRVLDIQATDQGRARGRSEVEATRRGVLVAGEGEKRGADGSRSGCRWRRLPHRLRRRGRRARPG